MPRRSLQRLFRPGPRQGVDWELRHHIEERTDRLVDEGWDRIEARKEAERLFGNIESYRNELVGSARTFEERRWIMGWIDTLAQDVRYAFRNIRRSPGFAAALILTLGLGIGANAAIFSVVDALLIRPLPYLHSDRLVETGLQVDGSFTVPWVNADQVDELRESADYFEATAMHGDASATRTDGPEPETLSVLAASHDLDDLLGAPIVLGRAFTRDDARASAAPVVLLTQGAWRRMGSDPDVVGRDLRLDGTLHTVVGVIGQGFKYPVPGRHELWVPILDDGTAVGRAIDRVRIVGRLREGVTLSAAQERADAITAALEEEAPHDMGWSIRLAYFGGWRANPDVERASFMLSGAVFLILLIALVNSINLLLVRGSSREQEMSVRTAIGASRARLLRQVLTESFVLATAAGLLAVGLAWGAGLAAQSLMPTELRWSSVYEFTVERRTLLFTFVLTWVVGLLLGALPALQATRLGRHLSGRIGRRATTSARKHTLEHLLLGVEVAMAVALLAGAGLFMNSFTRLTGADPGFEPERVLMMDLSLSSTRYSSGGERADFYHRLAEKIAAIPGVEAVARADGMPPDAGMAFGEALQTDEGFVPQDQPFWIPMAGGSEGYLEALGIELRAGRPLTRDDADLRNVIVDQPMADLLWPQESPLGRRFRIGEDGKPYTVVGVSEDLRLMGMDDRQGRFDFLYALDPASARSFGSLAIRTSGNPAGTMSAVRQAVLELDGQQPIGQLITGRQAMAESLEKPRFLVTVMGLLAAVATLLSMVGIYGIASWVVGRRRKEIGIRIALGSPLGRVRRQVLARALAWAGAGTALGLALAIVLDSAAGDLLYGIEPGDPLTYGAAALLMLLVAALAGDAPAREASRVDPGEVLRTE